MTASISKNGYKKKLIEVAMPLEAINKASIREKSIRHGHPSTLHLWWARRPLATCRAVLFAQLVDDPSSHPNKFPTETEQSAERKRLFNIIEKLVVWENSNDETILAQARAEIKKSCGGKLPPIYDPFSGGGSIPLEAQRLGLPAYGSDLNPVAVMIGKAMIEIPPKFKDCPAINPIAHQENQNNPATYRYAQGLAADVKYYGEWMREQAWAKIGQFYPPATLPDGGTATVVAWIWARTVPSPNPALQNVAVPLLSTLDLCSVAGKEAWLEPIIDGNEYRFEIRTAKQGHRKEDIPENIRNGTVNRNGAICLVSGTAMPLTHVRAQGKAGKIGQLLIAIVAESPRSRLYLPADATHENLVKQAKPTFRPEMLIANNPRDFRTQLYGMESYGDLFTDRQLLTLNQFSSLLDDVRLKITEDAIAAGLTDDNIPLRDSDGDGGNGALAYAEAISVYLAFVIDKCADYGSSICTWNSGRDGMRSTFGRQAIPMVWDFAEVNPFSASSGNWHAMLDWVCKVVAKFNCNNQGGLLQHDAQSVKYPDDCVISSDPPYYDNIGYADLSDFFFCWLKPNLQSIYPDLFNFINTPKQEELVATPYRHKNREEAENFFLNGMGRAIKNMVAQTNNHCPATIYYAFKQSEIAQEGISSTGWATFLQAVIDAGYAVVGTWPMRTEKVGRMIANGTNALANSIVLVCRKRAIDAEIGTRAEFTRQLKAELPAAIKHLKASNIAPADIPQSSIGPGIGIFSRYEKILEKDDSVMSVKTALQLINNELAEGEHNFDDETLFALIWFEQNAFQQKNFGDANNIANAKGIAVQSLVDTGIAASSAGKFRLLPRNEMADDWQPQTDAKITVWKACQYLIRTLEAGGEKKAANLMKQLGEETSENVKILAYQLYEITANKHKDAKAATAYNGLISAWGGTTTLINSIDKSLGYTETGSLYKEK